MTTLTAHADDDLDEGSDEQLPGRPRQKLLNRVTVPLLVLLIAAGGFLGGIEVEKGHGGGTSTSVRSGAASFGGSSFPSGGFSASGGRPGASGAKSGASGARSSAGAGFPSAAGGFGGGAVAGGGTVGTISSISGRTIYLKETSGTTIKVDLTSATTLKKDLRIKRGSVRPGDTITVEGITGSGGSIKASSISDSGDTSSSSSSSSGSS